MGELSREYRLVVERAYAELGDPGGDPMAIGEPHRSVALIDTCLGLIENGGIEYLFECQLPHQPSYTDIAVAFRNCGAEAAADLLVRAAALLPGERPHLKPGLRQSYLANPSGQFKTLAHQANELFWMDAGLNDRVVAYARAAAA